MNPGKGKPHRKHAANSESCVCGEEEQPTRPLDSHVIADAMSSKIFVAVFLCITAVDNHAACC